MKKILAGIIAITTVFCTFTGCGSTNDEKKSENNSSIETTAESKEESSEEETKKNSEEDKESKTDDKVYEDVINKYIDAVNSKDLDKVFELQMPDGCTDVAKFRLMQEYSDLLKDVESDKRVDELMKNMTAVMPALKLNKVVCVENPDEDELNSLKNTLANHFKIADYIEKHGGIKNVDIDKFQYSDLDQSDNSDSIKINDAKFVTFETIEEGKDEPSEEKFYIYRINGGEWHIDNSLLDLIAESYDESESNNARSLYAAANTALIDCDDENEGALYSVMNKVLICSDESKNINVPDGLNYSDFIKNLNNYFENVPDFDWFVVIDQMSVKYAAIVKKDQSKIAIYPYLGKLNAELKTEKDDSFGSKSFDEVYDMCAELLK
ncbi:MAG: hypothetical protein K6G33_00520 [Ruminococcus sp.]|uniref:hypothetical protein n=1 Tax=Ruminococcus sp. TaxID=41978 RepID=UPI0025E2585A|nr:hypothetical protein [Ruminococcus sp.]MCR5599217.1 hypothetical protein [Ruminococcus sp.]